MIAARARAPIGFSSPPLADPRHNGLPLAEPPIRIVPSDPQVAPPPARSGSLSGRRASVLTTVPARSTVLRKPPPANAIVWESGDQKIRSMVSRPVTGRAARLSRGRTQRRVPSEETARNATKRPSGETSKFRHEERRAVVRANVVDQDVRVVEGRHGPGLLLETGEPVQRGGDHLDRDVPSEPVIPRAIDLAHPTGANRAGDFIRLHASPNRQRHHTLVEQYTGVRPGCDCDRPSTRQIRALVRSIA